METRLQAIVGSREMEKAAREEKARSKQHSGRHRQRQEVKSTKHRKEADRCSAPD